MPRHRRGPVRDFRFTTWDFRFLQAWVQRLDLADAWTRYQSHLGAAHAKRIRFRGTELLRQLQSVASRLDEPGAVALLREAERVGVEDKPDRLNARQAPSLEEFRESLDDPDFYSEKELLDLWTESFGEVASRQARTMVGTLGAKPDQTSRVKQQQRQMTLLHRLEREVVQPPLVTDPLSTWLQPPVARRLGAAGVHTVEQLLETIGKGGAGWHRAIHRLGPVCAQGIESWLRRHASHLQPQGMLTETSSSAGATGLGPPNHLMQPLERLKLDEPWSDDLYSVQSWITKSALRGRPHFVRACRKEAERLLLWAAIERKRRLQHLTSEDARDYLAFLANPPPEWTAPRGNRRSTGRWRPLEGPLSMSSRRTALAVLRLMYDETDIAGSTGCNPWRRVDALA